MNSLLLALAPTLAMAALPEGYGVRDYELWRETRVANLTRPTGWLSLVGLHWLEPGRQLIGADAKSGIQLSGGPARLGTIVLDAKAKRVWLEESGSDVLVDGQVAGMRRELVIDSAGPPSVVQAGSLSFIVIERSGKIGLRVRNSEASTLTQFKGLEYFPHDGQWVIEAKYESFKEPKMLEVGTVIGTIEPTPSPGIVRFEIDGKPYSLQPTGTPDELFFVFADRTSGKETYGAARFLYSKVVDGKVVLDFNRAYNPPCAFTPYATCPLPTPENRLDLAVRAGEKKYAAGAH
jgi:hypothetical protein